MKKFYSYIVCPLVVIVAIAVVYRIYSKFQNTFTITNIKFIRSHLTAGGRMVDPHGEICVETVDDVKLYVTKKTITIKYGKILLEWRYNDFLKESYDADLTAIGITRKVDPETAELKVFFKGVEIPRYAK